MILSFKGPHEYLSNFSDHHIRYGDHIYPTAEHLYQALKTLDPGERELVRIARTPGQAKRQGNKVKLRPDWDDLRIGAMTMVVMAKFGQNPELVSLLLSTGDQHIVEGNRWHDNFWGVCYCDNCPGHGENRLGKILMTVREQLTDQEI